MATARVFPRKTTASPTDNLAFFGPPQDEVNVDEVHVSVSFTYDIDKAFALGKAWEQIAPVKYGGPAFDSDGNEFDPGLYVKDGYVITSRGCHNKCWFCDVWRREGQIVRELEIKEGWNLLDSNILACSTEHIKKVFAMLKRQERKPCLSGGLEAKILTDEHVSLLWDLRPDQMFFAYDTEDDLEPLLEAGKKLRYANFTRRHMRCFVLIGYKGDTFDKAQKRLLGAWEAGFMPMAMLYKNKKGEENKEWRQFQRVWARPAIMKAEVKRIFQNNI